MDIPEIPPYLMTAGKDFDSSLRSLGLRSDALSWGFDVVQNRFFLLLVWGGIDRYGPLSFGKLLFKAYNASALPQQIDPLIIQAVSAKHPLGERVLKMVEPKAAVRYTMTDHNDPLIHFQKSWVVSNAHEKHSIMEVTADWKRFNERVSQLAA